MTSTYASLPGKANSLWLDTTANTDFPILQSGETVDVAIIGGGIVGLTAATLLKAEGKTVAVIDANRIVHGVTGHTTAKITSLHTLIYDYLITHFGIEKAQAYADANQAAIEQIATLVNDKQIECDFIRTEAYTYTESDKETEQIKAEVKSATSLGLPATFLTQTPLPFSVKAAVRFDNQAQFHPRKYLLALAQEIPGDGSFLFENSRAVDITGNGLCVITTEHGDISARDVIIASHFPFNDKALYASRLNSHRSYVLAVRTADAVAPGMFISPEPTHSLRRYPTPNDNMLLVGGEGHITGQGGDTIARYKNLEQWAREHFDVKSVEYRWSTQDNRTSDRVPYIGLASPSAKHVYVATGFGGWGMTNGTAAGMLLRDLILETDNPWSEVYDPNRLNLIAIPDVVKHTADIAKHFVGDRLQNDGPNDLSPGEGKIVDTANGNAAMYKDDNGVITALSPVCTHMGCFVQWNAAEKSWDCPCHGSRFSTSGTVIHGPAIKCLEKLETL
jgi:glycine/D-amino acid oxidase-like deaminating enzyme/nitrite reductase/ring-hydroxylating ferredoxin subunit